jgi:hypothetical protein
MPHTALVVLTAKDTRSLLEEQGCGNWRLDADRARQCAFLVCTQNAHHPDPAFFPTAPHGAAFLIGRVAGVVPAMAEPGRWLIKIAEYAECNIPNIWQKSGPGRYPVRYTTLEALGIDPTHLPPFRPVPPRLRGMADAGYTPPLPPPGALLGGTPAPPRPPPMPMIGQDPWARLETILDQLDRIPDLPNPVVPLDWDEAGLPR